VLSDLIIRLCLDAAAFREQLVQRREDNAPAATLIGAGATFASDNFITPPVAAGGMREKKRENSKGRQIIRLVNSFIASLSSK